MRRSLVVVAAGALVTGLLGTAPALAAKGPAPSGPSSQAGPTVYTGQLTPQQLGQLRESGVDHESIATGKAASAGAGAGKVAVEAVLSQSEAAKAKSLGLPLVEKKVDGTAVSRTMATEAAAGYTVFRSYSEPGGIRDELIALAKQYPNIAKLQSIGSSVNGQQILGLKVTRGATQLRDGARPSVLYTSTQHAREWITPEMNRRLLRYYLENYTRDAQIRRIVDTTELWFVPVVNPDGYDFTFTEGNRLWRKNLRDNDGDGQITGVDGVDLNRNFPTDYWGYDNEGSSPSIGSQTYRGTGPASEPETRAQVGLLRKVRPKFQVNYHSAAELLLYGVGWQVATRSPDDILSETLAGDDARPAVPGYDPDQSAELYTTNGDTIEYSHGEAGTVAFTPEMATCETASAVDPEDAFEPEDCESGFNFPDSEVLVQAEFEKNIPFAVSIAKSAQRPSDPVSAIGRRAPDFETDPFTVSYGDPQPVAVTAKREIRGLTLNYQINGKRVQRSGVREWRGGERYGGEMDIYYAEYRGVVRGARPGDQVKVWFSGFNKGRPTSSQPFTYRLAQDTGAKVLVLANEDYKGVNPTYPPAVTAPKYATTYVDALRAKGISSTVFDVDASGVPHHLGVLSHFKGVVWYLGDNRLTQDPEDFLTQYGSNQLEDLAVAERAQYLTIAVRDYLNEGGKLVHTGETAQYYGLRGSSLYYGLNGDPTADCVVSVDPNADCLILSNDFSQYYLGAFNRSVAEGPTGFQGLNRLAGVEGVFGGAAVADNPLDEPGTFTVTSDVLPPEDFPQFASQSAGAYEGASGGAFEPVEGSWYAGGVHVDDSYMRLTRTVDLTGVTAAQAPALRAQLSYDTEEDYDHVIVEAHTVGGDDWTTLAAPGATSTDVPADCEQGFLLTEHPFLGRYLTQGDPCTNTGTTGSWNALSGSSGGWQQLSFDLSAFAGKQVEVSISYVTDPNTGGVGVFIDDTAIVVGGVATQAEGFESGLGAWSLPGAPAGSPPGGGNFERAQALVSAAVTTRDTVLLGFGVEQLATPAERAAVLGKAVSSLLR